MMTDTTWGATLMFDFAAARQVIARNTPCLFTEKIARWLPFFRRQQIGIWPPVDPARITAVAFRLSDPAYDRVRAWMLTR